MASSSAAAAASASTAARFLHNAGPRSSALHCRSLPGARPAPRTRMPLEISRRHGGIGVARATHGENPTWEPEDFVVLGLGHCFIEDPSGKLQDHFVIEPIGAGALECMENGGKTSYKHIASTTLGVALKQDVALLPEELRTGAFCTEFEFRTKCAARSWKREYPQEKLVRLVPLGTVRSDFNYNLEDKRVLNMVNVVTDADNIKQDMSIDVYGRKKDEDGNSATDAAPPSRKELDKKKSKGGDEDDVAAQIASLYNA